MLLLHNSFSNICYSCWMCHASKTYNFIHEIVQDILERLWIVDAVWIYSKLPLIFRMCIHYVMETFLDLICILDILDFQQCMFSTCHKYIWCPLTNLFFVFFSFHLFNLKIKQKLPQLREFLYLRKLKLENLVIIQW